MTTSGLDISRTLITVSTCERPNTSNVYLWKTLRSLTKAGLLELNVWGTVLSDGPIGEQKPPPPDFEIRRDVPAIDSLTEKPIITDMILQKDALKQGDLCTWGLHATPVRLGARANLWRAFQLAAADPAIDRLVFFEDDIQCLGIDALYRIISCPFHETDGFISFFDMKELPYGAQPGLHQVPIMGVEGNGFWGLQAVAFPRRVFVHLASQDPWSVFQDIPMGASDRCLEAFLDRTEWNRYSVHCPSLVAHMGHDSAVEPGQPLGGRFTKNPAPADLDCKSYFGKNETRWYWKRWGKPELWRPS